MKKKINCQTCRYMRVVVAEERIIYCVEKDISVCDDCYSGHCDYYVFERSREDSVILAIGSLRSIDSSLTKLKELCRGAVSELSQGYRKA